MVEEKPELPISPQVRQPADQIQPPASPSEASSEGGSFLDKLKLHKFKILGGVLGVLVFAGAVFGAYKVGQRQVQLVPQPTPTPGLVATPTPDPTANWKTYTNEKYGYSIKYPPADSYMSFTPKNYTVTNMAVLDYIGIGEDPDSREPLIVVAVTDRSFDEEVKLTRQNLSVEEEKEMIIEGVKGVEFYGKRKGRIRHVFWIVLPKTDYTYVISTPEYNILDGFATFNLMLSTFKFLE